MFTTYTIVATKLNRTHHTVIENVVAEVENVRKNELETTINGLVETFGSRVRIDVLTYKFGKCINMVSNY